MITRSTCAACKPPAKPARLTLEPASQGGYVVWVGGNYDVSNDRYPREMAFAGKLADCLTFMGGQMEAGEQ